MHLEFTAEQDELRDGVRAMLARECPISLVREIVEKGTTPDALWNQMVELGWSVPPPLAAWTRARRARDDVASLG